MKRILLALCLFFPALAHGQAVFFGQNVNITTGCGNGFTHCESLTVNASQVGGSDIPANTFPIRIAGTTADGLVANGGYRQTAYDDGFYTSSSCSTKVPWETVVLTATGTGSEFHALNPVILSASTNTLTFVHCVGNPSITTDQSNATGTCPSNYVAWYHLPNGSSLTTNDTCANALNLTNSGATATTGVVDGAAAFGGSAYLAASSYAPTNFTNTSPFTLSLYVNTSATSGELYLSNTQPGAGYRGWQLDEQGSSGGGQIEFYIINSYPSNALKITVPEPAAATTTRVTCTYDGSQSTSGMKCYANGVLQTVTSVINALSATSAGTTPLYVGAQSSGGANFSGWMDEITILSAAQTAGWDLAHYNNDTAPGTFYTLTLIH